MVRAVRLNQWVVSGCQADKESLDRAVLSTFENTALSLYNFYRNIRSTEAILRLVPMPEKLGRIIEAYPVIGRGLVVVGIHLSNFDLALIATVQQCLKYDNFSKMAISVPNPGRGYRKQNDLRQNEQFPVIPGSFEAVKAANKVLASGGVVVTGIDRPLSENNPYRPVFFSHPAELPTIHVSLALRYHTPVVVTGLRKKPGGGYEILISDPVEMVRCSNRHEEILANAQRVLQVAEEYIYETPLEWSMFYPVWPDLLPAVP